MERPDSFELYKFFFLVEYFFLNHKEMLSPFFFKLLVVSRKKVVLEKSNVGRGTRQDLNLSHMYLGMYLVSEEA